MNRIPVVTLLACVLLFPAAAAAKPRLVRHLGKNVHGFVPGDIAVDAKGHIVVTSALTGKAVFFSARGKVVAKPSIKSGEASPVAISPQGRVAIAPQVGDSIPAFSTAGNRVGEYPSAPDNGGGLRVSGLAYDPAGNLYGTNVGSQQGQVIGVWAPDFSFTRGLPIQDTGYSADEIEAGPNGLLYYDTNASDGETVLIMRLRPDGTYLSPIRLNSNLSLSFVGFAVDRRGDLFVLTSGIVPYTPFSVWRLSPSGGHARRLLRIRVPQHRTPPRQGNGIRYIAVDPSGKHIFLSDIDHRRVDEYRR